MSIIVNLTPHELNVVKKDGSIMTIAPSGQIARVGQSEEVIGVINGAEVTQQIFDGEVTIPQPEDKTYFVVSRLAASALAERGRKADILVPGPAVRDDQGKIVGCRGFSQL